MEHDNDQATEEYAPYDDFEGVWVPNWLIQMTEVSALAKLLYSRMARYAGPGVTQVYPKQDELATDLGVATRSIIRAMKSLTDAGLLKSERRGLGKSNSYTFIKHDAMKKGSRKKPKQLDTNMADQEVTSCHFSSDDVSLPNKTEKRLEKKDIALDTLERESTVGSTLPEESSPSPSLSKAKLPEVETDYDPDLPTFDESSEKSKSDPVIALLRDLQRIGFIASPPFVRAVKHEHRARVTALMEKPGWAVFWQALVDDPARWPTNAENFVKMAQRFVFQAGGGESEKTDRSEREAYLATRQAQIAQENAQRQADHTPQVKVNGGLEMGKGAISPEALRAKLDEAREWYEANEREGATP